MIRQDIKFDGQFQIQYITTHQETTTRVYDTISQGTETTETDAASPQEGSNEAQETKTEIEEREQTQTQTTQTIEAEQLKIEEAEEKT